MSEEIKAKAEESVTVLVNIDNQTINSVYSDTNEAIEVCRKNRDLAPFTFPLIKSNLSHKEDLEASGNKSSEVPCDAPFKANATIEQENNRLRDALEEILCKEGKQINQIYKIIHEALTPIWEREKLLAKKVKLNKLI